MSFHMSLPVVAVIGLICFLYIGDLYPPLPLGSQQQHDANTRDGLIDFAMVDVFGADTFASSYALGMPRVRMLVGSPPVALIVAVSLSNELHGLHVWSSKVRLSTSVQFLNRHEYGWEILDTLHAGAALTHRPGAGSAAFRPGIPVIMTYHDVPMLPGCDGVFFLGIHAQNTSVLAAGLFNTVLFTPRYLTLAITDSQWLLDNIQRDALDNTARFALVPHDSDKSSQYAVAGRVQNVDLNLDIRCSQIDGHTHVDLFLWSGETLQVGVINHRRTPQIRLSSSLIPLAECLCGTTRGEVRLANFRVDRKQFCDTGHLIDHSLEGASISLPWGILAPLLVVTKPNLHSAEVMLISNVPYAVQNVRYGLFFFYALGSIVWYLRDRLAPMPSVWFDRQLVNFAELHMVLEIKILVASFMLLIVFNAIHWEHGYDGHSFDLYERFEFNTQSTVALIGSVLCVYISWCVHLFSKLSSDAKGPLVIKRRPATPTVVRLSHTLPFLLRLYVSFAAQLYAVSTSTSDVADFSVNVVDLVLLTSCRSYFVASLISVFVEHSAMLCSSGVTLHVLSTAVWMWNVRTYIDLVLRVCGYKYITHYMKDICSSDVQDVAVKKPQPWSILLCLLAVAHATYSVVIDMMDRTIGVTTVILPAHGLSFSILIYSLLLFEAIDTAKQRYQVATAVSADRKEQ